MIEIRLDVFLNLIAKNTDSIDMPVEVVTIGRGKLEETVLEKFDSMYNTPKTVNGQRTIMRFAITKNGMKITVKRYENGNKKRDQEF